MTFPIEKINLVGAQESPAEKNSDSEGVEKCRTENDRNASSVVRRSGPEPSTDAACRKHFVFSSLGIALVSELAGRHSFDSFEDDRQPPAIRESTTPRHFSQRPSSLGEQQGLRRLDPGGAEHFVGAAVEFLPAQQFDPSPGSPRLLRQPGRVDRIAVVSLHQVEPTAQGRVLNRHRLRASPFHDADGIDPDFFGGKRLSVHQSFERLRRDSPDRFAILLNACQGRFGESTDQRIVIDAHQCDLPRNSDSIVRTAFGHDSRPVVVGSKDSDRLVESAQPLRQLFAIGAPWLGSVQAALRLPDIAKKPGLFDLFPKSREPLLRIPDIAQPVESEATEISPQERFRRQSPDGPLVRRHGRNRRYSQGTGDVHDGNGERLRRFRLCRRVDHRDRPFPRPSDETPERERVPLRTEYDIPPSFPGMAGDSVGDAFLEGSARRIGQGNPLPVQPLLFLRHPQS